MCKKLGKIIGSYNIKSHPNQKTYSSYGKRDGKGEQEHSGDGNTVVPRQGWLEWYVEQNTEVDDYDYYQQ
jgi:hypothetical protein